MRRGSYRDRAVVVRTHDFGEADRVIVLLTEQHGLVRAVAKGVRRAKSRFGSRLQPFVVLDVALYEGRNLDTITGADTVAYYASELIEDWDRYSAAAVVLETAEKIARHSDHDPRLFAAVVAALEWLQFSPFPTATVDSFLLQAMSAEGWAPSLFNCAACGTPGPHHAFHPAVGGAVCYACRPSQSADVPAETLHLMWLLAEGRRAESAELLQSSEGPILAERAHRLVTAHLQWHMDTKITSLKIMNQH